MKLEQYKELCRKKIPELLFGSYTQRLDDNDVYLGYYGKHIAAELWIDLDGEGGIYLHFFEYDPQDKEVFSNNIFEIIKENITSVEFDDVVYDVFGDSLDVMITPCLDENKGVKDKVCYWRLHDGEWDYLNNEPQPDSKDFKLRLPLHKYCAPRLGFELNLYGIMYVVDNFYTEPDENGVYDVWIVRK